ncbi:MAG: ABC transporter permease [Endomicrobiales bacterium]
MLTFKMALRNVLRQKRRTVLTVLTMVGGFTLAALSFGWSDGSYSYIISAFTRNRFGHIQVHAKGYLDNPSLHKVIPEYASVGERVARVKGVTAWAPRVYAATLVSVGEKSTGAQITGIDPAQETNATRFDKKLISGKNLPEQPGRGVILGSGLARLVKAKPGDEAVLVSQAADGSLANDVFTVVGIAESGDAATDRTALYMHIRDAQSFLALEGRAHELAVIVDKIKRVEKTAQDIAAALDDPGLSVEPWQVFARSFYRAMLADQAGNWIMMVIITIIVAVGVLNTVLMSVLERRREFGLLKAVGTRPGQIVLLVLAEVAVLAAISIVVGALLGSLANYLVSLRGIALPQSFTYGGVKFERLYAEISARSLYIPAITVFVTATLVSLFPAVHAARTDPAKSMQAH